MKLQRKYLRNFIIWLFYMIFCLALIYNARINERVAVLKDIEALDNNFDYASGYFIEGTHFISNNNDPQICFNQINAQIGSIGIVFEQPLEQDISVQIYYAEPGTWFEEPKSVIRTIAKGETEKYINLPVTIYEAVRVDIGGEFYLKEIVKSSVNTSYKEINTTVRITEIIAAMLLAAGLLIGTIFSLPRLKKKVNALKENWGNLSQENRICYAIVIITFVLWGILWLTTLISTEPLDTGWQISLFVITLLECILFLGLKLKLKKFTPEFAVFFILFIFGSYLCVALPLGGGTSFDGQIHYERTLEMSHILDKKVTLAELEYTKPYFESINNAEDYSARKNEINQLYLNITSEVESITLSNNLYVSIPYLPSAIMLFIGRGLSMPFHSIFMLGRWGNVLLYSIIVFFAIRKLKSGKMIMAVIALFPLNIFLSASYTYDTWLTAFFMLGTAYIISVFQQSKKTITKAELFVPLVAYFLGCSAKAIYFPVFLFLLFYPKSLFQEEKIYKRFRLLTMAVLAFVVFSFLIPMFITQTASITDTRGGTEVQGSAQIKHILNNPIHYSKTLFTFLKDYLSLNKANEYIEFFAYLGRGKHFIFVLVLLGIVVFTDKNEFDCRVPLKFRFFSCAVFIVTVMLVASALYITFTPVGADTIAGCQPRYLIPLLFPVLSVLGSGKMIQKHSAAYSPIIIGCMLYVLVSDFASCFLKLYF